VIRQPALYAALTLYGFSTVLWIWIMSRLPLMQAHPWVDANMDGYRTINRVGRVRPARDPGFLAWRSTYPNRNPPDADCCLVTAASTSIRDTILSIKNSPDLARGP
jgi:hypothetical protein